MWTRTIPDREDRHRDREDRHREDRHRDREDRDREDRDREDKHRDREDRGDREVREDREDRHREDRDREGREDRDREEADHTPWPSSTLQWDMQHAVKHSRNMVPAVKYAIYQQYSGIASSMLLYCTMDGSVFKEILS